MHLQSQLIENALHTGCAEHLYFPSQGRELRLRTRKRPRGFRLCGGGQRALRSPFGNLRPLRGRLLAGRSGSVSRCDHNHAYRRRAHAAWAHKSEGRVKPIPSYSSGEGVWGRGASLREAASPPESPPPRRLFEREREGGDFSSEKSPPSQNSSQSFPIFFHFGIVG